MQRLAHTWFCSPEKQFVYPNFWWVCHLKLLSISYPLLTVRCSCLEAPTKICWLLLGEIQPLCQLHWSHGVHKWMVCPGNYQRCDDNHWVHPKNGDKSQESHKLRCLQHFTWNVNFICLGWSHQIPGIFSNLQRAHFNYASIITQSAKVLLLCWDDLSWLYFLWLDCIGTISWEVWRPEHSSWVFVFFGQWWWYVCNVCSNPAEKHVGVDVQSFISVFLHYSVYIHDPQPFYRSDHWRLWHH